MNQQDLNITSVSGAQLYAKLWKTKDKPKAVVVLVHGFGEHCSRYTSYFNLFDKENFAFVGMDHIGHGQSEGKRGVIKSYEQLLDDVAQLVNRAKELYPDTPVFLYGHSMGGNIALNFLLRRQCAFTGAIISSPWLKLSKEPNIISQILIRLFNCLLPNLTVNSGLDSNNISSDKQEVEQYKKDELNHGRISFRLLNAVTKQGKWAMNNTHLLKTPTLLVHGNKDHVTSHLASKHASSLNSKMIKYVEFEGIYHEIHNDDAREQLAHETSEWINSLL